MAESDMATISRKTWGSRAYHRARAYARSHGLTDTATVNAYATAALHAAVEIYDQSAQ